MKTIWTLILGLFLTANVAKAQDTIYVYQGADVVYKRVITTVDSVTFHKNYPITDIDGNIYHAITIGTQTWMVENLKTTKYRDGSSIPNVTDGNTWTGLTSGAYCDYNNLSSNSSVYGRLYNWYTVKDSRNVAPLGWHVPTDAEWTILSDYLGGLDISGGKIKEIGTSHWNSPNTGATNQSGFSALPGGNRNYDGQFVGINNASNWLSTTEFNIDSAWYRNCASFGNYIWRGYANGYKTGGLSIRCIKD